MLPQYEDSGFFGIMGASDGAHTADLTSVLVKQFETAAGTKASDAELARVRVSRQQLFFVSTAAWVARLPSHSDRRMLRPLGKGSLYHACAVHCPGALAECRAPGFWCLRR